MARSANCPVPGSSKPCSLDACKVSLNLQFDFSNVLVGKVVGPIFKFIADSMVESFVRQADEIYND